MYKGTLELCRINSQMKLKFNLIIKDDMQLKAGIQAHGTKALDVFKYGGTEYLRLAPKPYLTVDISGSADKNDEWNSNTRFNLNKFFLFELMKKVKSMLNKFKIPDMYYIQNKRLHINADLASKNAEYMRTMQKTIKMMHIVVYDKENKELEYEGICLMINGVDNFCCLTFQELEYLYYELTQVNLNMLAANVINTYILTQIYQKVYRINSVREISIPKIVDEKPQEEIETRALPVVKDPQEIPPEI